MATEHSDKVQEAASQVMELEEELESSGHAATAGDVLEKARANLHQWVDSVVGVVVSKLNAAKVAQMTGGDIPQNVNFAIKGPEAAAFLAGRGYVTPQDVKKLAPDVLRHRVAVSYEAEAENITSDDLIQKILDTLPVP